jgi:hypothetical protein
LRNAGGRVERAVAIALRNSYRDVMSISGFNVEKLNAPVLKNLPN